MAVGVADVTKEVVKAAILRMGGPIGRLWIGLSLEAPLANGHGCVVCPLQHRRQCVIVFQGLVELIVTDIGMTLVNAQQQRCP